MQPVVIDLHDIRYLIGDHFCIKPAFITGKLAIAGSYNNIIFILKCFYGLHRVFASHIVAPPAE